MHMAIMFHRFPGNRSAPGPFNMKRGGKVGGGGVEAGGSLCRHIFMKYKSMSAIRNHKS